MRADTWSVPATYRGQPAIPKYFRGTSNKRPRLEPRASAPGNMRTRSFRRTMRRRRRRGRRLRKIFRRVPRTLSPPSKIVKARIVYPANFATTTTTTTVRHILVHMIDVTNPITDVSGSATGYQPQGFDQWAAFYRRAKVLGCKVTFTLHNAGDAAIVFGIMPLGENNVTTAAAWDIFCERPGGKYRILSPEVDHAVLSYRCSTKRVFKIKDIKDTDDIACSLATQTAPNRSNYFSCWVSNHSAATTAKNVDIILKVEYIVLLDQPLSPARSSA